MKEIVIISGKGGTGKTSVTGSLAVLADNSVLADCDVDAADLHLLLNPSIQEQHDFFSGNEAIIDREKCISCGKCFELCRFDAVEIVNELFSVKDIACEGCGVCVQFCPEKAIHFPESHCGEWFRSDTEQGTMIHARLKAGAENSGKLVSTVRREARNIAEKSGSEWIIVDGPPGIGCPVISSISGVDAAVIVTEPTLSGKHDLERVQALAEHFKVPVYIVINKWDLNRNISDNIVLWAKEKSIPVLGKLPYSPLFNRAQAEGKPVVIFRSQSSESSVLKQLWNKIQSAVGAE